MQYTMTEIMNGEEYLTAQEAADLLDYSRQWFIERVAPRYHLKTYQKGVKKYPLLYKKSDIDALIGVHPREKESGEDVKE